MSRKRGKNAGKPVVNTQRPSRSTRRGVELTYFGRFPSDAEVHALQDWFSRGAVAADGPAAAAAVSAYRGAMMDFMQARIDGEANPVRQAMVVAALAAAVAAVSDLRAAGRVRRATPEEARAGAAEMLGRAQAAGLPLEVARSVSQLLGYGCER